MRNEDFKYNQNDYTVAYSRMRSHGLGLDMLKLWEAGAQPEDIADEIVETVRQYKNERVARAVLKELELQGKERNARRRRSETRLVTT